MAIRCVLCDSESEGKRYAICRSCAAEAAGLNEEEEPSWRRIAKTSLQVIGAVAAGTLMLEVVVVVMQGDLGKWWKQGTALHLFVLVATAIAAFLVAAEFVLTKIGDWIDNRHGYSRYIAHLEHEGWREHLEKCEVPENAQRG